MKIQDLHNKRIAILGFWKEGRSTFIFLLKLGITNITILDKNASCFPVDYISDGEIPLGKIDDFLQCSWILDKHLQETNNIWVKIIVWDHYVDSLWDFDVIFKTPGISPFDEHIDPYREKLSSQTELFFDNYTGKTIGITATKGKSTISTILYKSLLEAGLKVKLVGNIGTPVLDEIDIVSHTDSYDYIIYELSSYMLDTAQPNLDIAILGNIYTDHLDWHLNQENYRRAKLNLLKNSHHKIINVNLQESSDIIKDENTYFFGTGGSYHAKQWDFFIGNTKVMDKDDVKIKWTHNTINITSIIWVFDILWLDIASIQNVTQNFGWLPHRLENIGTYKWITFIDDAISTTPESTLAGLRTYKDSVSTLFLWGTDRGYDFKELATYIHENNIRNIVFFPPSGSRIKAEIYAYIESLDSQKSVIDTYNILETNSMKEAVAFAYKHSDSWSICLLSTASPSYSNWKNFEAKGDDFKAQVIAQGQ